MPTGTLGKIVYNGLMMSVDKWESHQREAADFDKISIGTKLPSAGLPWKLVPPNRLPIDTGRIYPMPRVVPSPRQPYIVEPIAAPKKKKKRKAKKKPAPIPVEAPTGARRIILE